MKNSPFQFEKDFNMSAFKQCYGTEDKCREALFNTRWPDGYHCPKCGYNKYLRMNNGKAYECRRCRHKTRVYVRLFFLDDKLPLTTLFLVRYLFVRLKKEVSTPVTRPFYSAALSAVRKLRKAFEDISHALISDEYCALYIPWFARPHRWDNTTKIHRCYAKIEWQERKLYAIISAIAWPLKAVFFAVKRTLKFGARVKEKSGMPMTRQFFKQLYLAFRHFIPPSAFYAYRLFDPSKLELAPKYIHHHEICALLPFIISSKNIERLDDKFSFYQVFKKAGLPTIPIIAEFEKGKINKWTADTNGKLPESDLFAKPTDGIRGFGAKLYIYEKDGRYRTSDGHLLSQKELLDHLSEASRETSYLLQKRFFNHPDLSGFSVRALCTVRIVTCRYPGGPSIPLISILRMPTGMNITDNMRVNALGSPIHEETGTLGDAVSMDPAVGPVNRHPDTGHMITGVKIPFWPEIIQLALSAHDEFPEFSSIGWDIAVTKDGPLLVEGNPVWGIESLQRVHNKPLGESCFPETYLLDLGLQKRFTPTMRSYLLPT